MREQKNNIGTQICTSFMFWLDSSVKKRKTVENKTLYRTAWWIKRNQYSKMLERG